MIRSHLTRLASAAVGLVMLAVSTSGTVLYAAELPSASLVERGMVALIEARVEPGGATVRMRFIGRVHPATAVVDHGTLIITSTEAPPSPVIVGTRSIGAGLIANVVQYGGGSRIRISLPSATTLAGSRAADDAFEVTLAYRGEGARSDGRVRESKPAEAGTGSGQAAYTVVRLRYADAGEIAGVLTSGETIAPASTFNPAVGIFSLPQSSFLTTSNQSSASAAVQAPPGQSVSAEISIDRRLNAVILQASGERLRNLLDLIAQLDVPLAPVMLETTIFEVTESAARTLGIDFSPNGTLAVGSLSSSSFAKPTATAQFAAALYALAEKDQARIVASPRILALDGTSATIITGEAIPIITAITYPGSSSVVQQQVQYINVGVNLQIMPHVGTGTNIRSDIYAEVSSVTGYVQGVPRLSQRRTSTSAAVDSGASLVIGGLLQEQEIRMLQKVPMLGDLPLIGGLFQLSRTSRQRTNLYVLIKPRLVKSEQ